MKVLADPKWQGVGGIVAIISLVVAIIALAPHRQGTIGPTNGNGSGTSALLTDTSSRDASSTPSLTIPTESDAQQPSGGGAVRAPAPSGMGTGPLESPDAFRPAEVRERFLPQPYAQTPRALKDWLQTSGPWLYYRHGLLLESADTIPCDDIRAVGKFGWTWESGFSVVCFDQEWLGINVQEIIEQRTPPGGCARNINIVTRDPVHWGQHGAPPQVVGLTSVNFISFRVVQRGEKVNLEAC